MGIPEMSAGSGVVVSRGEVLWPAQDPARGGESGGQPALEGGTNGPIRSDTVAIASDCSRERRYNPRTSSRLTSQDRAANVEDAVSDASPHRHRRPCARAQPADRQ